MTARKSNNGAAPEDAPKLAGRVQDLGYDLTPVQKVLREYADLRNRHLSTATFRNGKYHMSGMIDGVRLPPLPTPAEHRVALARARAEMATSRRKAKR